MSSGNPFRRSHSKSNTSASAQPTDGAIAASPRSNTALDAVFERSAPIPTPSPQPKLRKQVRIRTPPPGTPISPEFKFSPFSHRQIPLPSPSEESSSLDSFDNAQGDPFDKDEEPVSSGEEDKPLGLDPNTIGVQASIRDGSSSTSALQGMPANPFQRTLADIEPDSGPDMKRWTNGNTNPEDKSKEAMDVNSFAQMLLGKRPHQGHGDAQLYAGNPTGTSSESSGVEGFQNTYNRIAVPGSSQSIESPQTSFDISHLGENRMERSIPAASEQMRGKRVPVPPKSRHGKDLNARTPPDALTAQGQRLDLDGSHKDDLQDTSIFLPNSAVSEDATLRDTAIGTSENFNAPGPRSRRTPPAVPLSRRHSQKNRSALGEPSDGRDHSPARVSEEKLNQPGSSESASFSPRAVPQPPPTRRRGHNSGSSVHNITSPKPIIQQATSSFIPRAPTGTRDPQISPPPAPPRRRGNSGRTSLDSQRSFPSDPSEDPASSTFTRPHEKNILADMDAFQAEIDAILRDGKS